MLKILCLTAAFVLLTGCPIKHLNEVRVDEEKKRIEVVPSMTLSPGEDVHSYFVDEVHKRLVIVSVKDGSYTFWSDTYFMGERQEDLERKNPKPFLYVKKSEK